MIPNKTRKYLGFALPNSEIETENLGNAKPAFYLNFRIITGTLPGVAALPAMQNIAVGNAAAW